MTIGNYNVFEVGTKVECSNIGSCNVFEQKSLIDGGSEIANNCRIGVYAKIP
jgi:hypothetical protein